MTRATGLIFVVNLVHKRLSWRPFSKMGSNLAFRRIFLGVKGSREAALQNADQRLSSWNNGPAGELFGT
jgi:hypothetical protein